MLCVIRDVLDQKFLSFTISTKKASSTYGELLGSPPVIHCVHADRWRNPLSCTRRVALNGFPDDDDHICASSNVCPRMSVANESMRSRYGQNKFLHFETVAATARSRSQSDFRVFLKSSKELPLEHSAICTLNSPCVESNRRSRNDRFDDSKSDSFQILSDGICLPCQL